MADNVDQDMVAMACMADLSRARQEELPLGQFAKRPTFQPGRNTGTSHIPREVKRQLESKWGAPIHDEESEQMEGLANENSRPWANITNQYMRHHEVATAPPRLAQGSYRPIIANLTNNQQPTLPSTRSVAFGRPPAQTVAPAPVRGGASTSTQNANGSLNVQPDKAVTSQNSTSVPRSVQASAAENTTAGSCRVELKRPPGDEGDLHEHELCQGKCEMMSGADPNSSRGFAVEFSMTVNLKTNHALLALTASGKRKRVHGVLDLDAPTLQGPVCLVTCPQNDFVYRLKFQKLAEAESFRHYLRILQQSAKQHERLASAQPAVGEPASLSTIDKVHETEEKSSSSVYTPLISASTALGGPRTTIGVKDTNGMPAEKINNGPADDEAEKPLIDIEDTSTEEVVVPKHTTGVTIDDAADQLQGLVQTILSTFAENGFEISEQTIYEVENAAIDNWCGRGLLKSAPHDMQLELIQLLKVLVRIKRKTELRQKAKVATSSPATEELRAQIQLPEKKQTRIQYTPEDMKKLEVKAVSPRQKETDIEAPAVAQTPSAQPTTSRKMLIPVLPKHKDWLASKPEPAMQAPSTLSMESWQDGNSIPSNTNSTRTRHTLKVVLPQASAQATENLSTISRQDGNLICSDKAGAHPRVALQEPIPEAPKAAQAKARPFQGLASSRWATQNDSWSVPATKPTDVVPSREEEVPRVVQGARATTKGLGASRWADKPVAFEGQFTGIKQAQDVPSPPGQS